MSFKIGDRIEVLADADYSPYAIVRQGERGEVVFSDCGNVDIRLDRYHPGLTEYGNCMWLYPEDGIRVQRVQGRCVPLARIAQAVAVAAALVCIVTLAPEGLRAARGPAAYFH